MAKMIIRCTEEDESGGLAGVPAQEAFFDGYQIAERQLEGVPVRIFHTPDGALDVEVCISAKTAKYLFLDLAEVREETLERIERGGFDVLASTKDLSDDDMMIYDDALSYEQQAFRAAPSFKIQSVE
jgi:hypothetical protein